MEKKLLCLIIFLGLLMGGCVTPGTSVREGRQLYSTVNDTHLPDQNIDYNLTFNPTTDVEELLPKLDDLPYPAPLKKRPIRRYTGIIKNKTKYEVEVPAGNSNATLVIPAHGFIEYTAWAKHFNLTAYHNGKPFYCMNIFANPRTYPFMCKKYDFMIEIVKGKPIKKKPRKRRRRRPGGVEAYG